MERQWDNIRIQLQTLPSAQELRTDRRAFDFEHETEEQKHEHGKQNFADSNEYSDGNVFLFLCEFDRSV